MAWYDLSPQRLLIERQAMAQRFPNFQLVKLEGGLAWSGTLTTNRGNEYPILVEYPDAFPDKPPTVKPLEELDTLDKQGLLKHQYPDGKLCLYWPGDRVFSQNTTAASVLANAAAWFFAYETWLESGKRDWPGNELDHFGKPVVK